MESFPWLARLARERIVLFVVLGGAIFAASSRARRSDDTIAFSGTELRVLRDAEAQRKGLDPRSLPLAGVIKERALEDEILYREGLKLGFDKGDGIVKQRVIQKTLFLAEELSGASEAPSNAALEKFFDQTRGRWIRPERWHFTHWFAHDRATIDDIAARDARGEDLRERGEACPVPRDASLTTTDLANRLGPDFVVGLQTAPVGTMSPPIHSSLGWHLVRVLEHLPAKEQTFEEAKASLRGTYVVEKREEAVSAFLGKASKNYAITIDGAKVDGISPSGRIALRSSGSGED